MLSLDDDIMMSCDDVERGFAAWRQQPHKIVGFYPRLITRGPSERLEYNWEEATVQQVLVLTHWYGYANSVSYVSISSYIYLV